MANHSYGLVLLAAGASSRMGQPKQLLPIHGRPLLRHVAEIALAAHVEPVVVVLGANAGQIKPALDGLAVHVVVNDAWSDGMASSLRTGIQTLKLLAPNLAGAIIALGDQPDLTAAHVTDLIEARNGSGRTIIATQVNGTLMPPALFAATHFAELTSLSGDAGARTLFQLYADQVGAVPLAIITDLDNLDDYRDYVRGEPR